MENTSQVETWISPDWVIDTSYVAEICVSSPPNIPDDYKLITFDTIGTFNLLPQQYPDIEVIDDIIDIINGESTRERYKSAPDELINYREYREKRGI